MRVFRHIWLIAFPSSSLSTAPVNANPRKQPRQARAKATVDALLEATAQVLLTHGYEGATTARVAERAGVSVGSLYQYFPNKEALVAALIERHAGQIIALMEQALSSPDAATLEGGLRALIRTGLDTQRIAPQLHKILNEQVPRVGRMAEVMDTGRKITALLEAYLKKHTARLPPGRDPALAALMVETALESLCHMAVIHHPERLTGGAMETEIYELISGYLIPPPGVSAVPGRTD